MTARRLAAWLTPGLVVSAASALAMGAFQYHWNRPEMSEMQVLQAFPDWWSSRWDLAAVMMSVYVIRSLWVRRLEVWLRRFRAEQ